jgi:cytochrome c biogenesis protein CcdA
MAAYVAGTGQTSLADVRGKRRIMIETLDKLLNESPLAALVFVFWAGAIVTLSSCIVLRLPVVLGYVAGAATSKKQGLLLTGLFSLGLVIGSLAIAANVAFISGGIGRIFACSKYLHWGLGLVLFVAGLLMSGLIDSNLLPEPWRQRGVKLRKLLPITGLLVGAVLGLLVLPACPNCGGGLLILARKAGTARLGFFGFVLFLGFALGQAVPVLALGALTSLGKPELIGKMRSHLCSIEQRIQLLAGNALMVLGIYFLVVG